MLETEIKKLTTAVTALTEVLQSRDSASQPELPGIPTSAAADTQPPGVSAMPGQQPAMPGQQPATPGQQPAMPGIPQAQPMVNPPPPVMSHQQAQAEIAAVAQQLGDVTRVQEVMVKYGSNQLNLIPADSLFAMVTEIQGLLQS